MTWLYINYTFPQYGVRCIAVSDHFDAINPNSADSDMAGVKNWFDEGYSKDTSRKIRAVELEQIRLEARSGGHIGSRSLRGLFPF